MNTFFFSENPIDEMSLKERRFAGEESGIVIEMCRDEADAMGTSWGRLSDQRAGDEGEELERLCDVWC